jgi:zinc protease
VPAIVAPLPPSGPDRSKPPAVAPPPVFNHGDPISTPLQPGVTLKYIQDKTSPKFTLDVQFQQGTWELGGVHDTLGDALGYLWDAATTTRSAEALAVEKDLAQIELWSDNGYHHTQLGLVAPRAEADHAFELLADVLQHPEFPGTSLAQYKREQSNWYAFEAPNDPATLASQLMTYAWFPADEPYGARPDLTALKKVSRGALAALHQKLLTTSPVVIHYVGDLPLDELKQRLAPALVGVGAAGPAGAPRATPVLPGERVYAVDLPSADQAVIRLRAAAPALGDPDSLAFEAVDWALGGAFLSRLNKNLREDKGWTYGIGSSYSRDIASGLWSTRVMLKPVNVADAITEIRKEIEAVVGSGITTDEIGGCWRERVAGWNNIFLDPSDALNTYVGLDDNRTSAAAWRERLGKLGTVSVAESQAAAARWLGASAPRTWIIVGNRAAIEPELAEVGLKALWVSPDDAVLGTFDRTATP